MGLTSDQATKLAPMLLAGVILAGGFSLVVLLSPRGEVPTIDFVPSLAEQGATSADFTTTWPESDWLALSANLRVLNHLAEGESGDPEVGGDVSAGGSGDAEPAVDEKQKSDYVSGNFQYVGLITMGDRANALVTLDGKQRFVGPGDEVGKHTIVSVHPDHLIVRVDGEERRMPIQEEKRTKLNSAQRYVSDRDRIMEQQRLQQERLRNNRGAQPDPGDGR